VPAFTHWLDDFFSSYYRHRPVNATFIGVHTYDDRLPDYSERGVDETRNEMAALRRRLTELPEEPLTRAEEMDRTLADGFLEIQDWEFQSRHFQNGNPSLYTGEAIFGILSLFLRPFAPLEERVESAILRLEALPALLAQGRANISAAPSAWTARAIHECDGVSIFLKSGIDLLMRDEAIDDQRLRHAADTAVEAFAAFRHWLSTDLSGTPSDAYACGAEALDMLLRRGHVLTQGADEIERYAAEQLRQSLAALDAGATAFGAADWQTALAGLNELHPTTEQYEAQFNAAWEAAQESAIAHDLITWPDYPIRYVPRPAWVRGTAPYLYFLYYRAPAAFDSVPIIDYLIAPLERDAPPVEREAILRATNDSVIKLNHVVHHGGIGHHLQNWHAYRAESRIGQVAAIDCASRIAMFCGGTMAEGWSSYVTDLMGEVGFLTPLEEFSQLHARARMAARALVDVRLHTGQLTLEEASALYQESVGMSAAAAQAEVVKNSMFPGAALIYLLGSDQIRDLRQEFRAREGAAFSLRHFHDRLLSYGSVPVSLIATAMRREPDPAM
jgi:hypothetical protein